MPSLTAAARVDLKDAVRHYLQSISNVNAIERVVPFEPTMAHLARFISQTFCSSARPLVAGYVYKMDIEDLVHNSGGDADKQKVDEFSLTEANAISITETLEKKRGVSIVYLVVNPTPPQDAHSCLIVFNARTKRQHFFNPWGYRDHWLSQAFAERAPLAEGFIVASLNEDNWAHADQSLQYIVDNNHFNASGNCSLYCMLVGILCTRFGFGKPRAMANLIKEALVEIDHANGFNVNVNHPASSHMSILWNWMGELITNSAILHAPALNAQSTVTGDMWLLRRDRREKAIQTLQNFPPMNNGNPRTMERRARLRQRTQNYLNTHPDLVVGSPVAPAVVAEQNQAARDAEVKLVRTMFPPAERCAIVTRKGKLCSRRSCVGQPLCWQHRHFTRNHKLTGPGRMRCAAVQQPC